MSEGFLDFGMGADDEGVGKGSETFKVKDETNYRVGFCWFSVRTEKGWDDEAAFNDDGTLAEEAMIRFAGCSRIYIKGVGNVLNNGPAYAKFGKPKDGIGTILIVWPTNDEGDLDVDKFKAGKGWQVMPWIHNDADKYKDLRTKHKRAPLVDHDVLVSCPKNGGEYQKMTFTSENESLLRRMMASKKGATQEVVKRILADVSACAVTLRGKMARDLTLEEIREKLGKEDSPVGDHAAKDVDKLLDDMDI